MRAGGPVRGEEVEMWGGEGREAVKVESVSSLLLPLHCSLQKVDTVFT